MSIVTAAEQKKNTGDSTSEYEKGARGGANIEVQMDSANNGRSGNKNEDSSISTMSDLKHE